MRKLKFNKCNTALFVLLLNLNFPLYADDDAAPYPLEQNVVEDKVQAVATQAVVNTKEITKVNENYKIGLEYDEGVKRPRNLELAKKYYKKAVSEGSLDAMNALGVIALSNSDPLEAKRFFERASKKGDEIADFNLGNLVLLMAGSPFEAEKYYIKSSEKNYSPAFVALGDLYVKGMLGKEDLIKAEKYYLKAAELGDDAGLDRISLLYLLQDGLDNDNDNTQNIEKIFKIFEIAAQKNNAQALYVLSLFYQNGYHVTADPDKALTYLKRSAELGYPKAEYALGYLYLGGISVRQNTSEGLKYFELAAKNNHPDAQNNLGMLYLKGDLVDKNYEKANYWLMQAVSNNNSMSMYNVGLINEAGIGQKIDLKKAYQFYLGAANGGYAPAYLKLAKLNATGISGVPQNKEQARAWLDKAIENDDEDAYFEKANAYFFGEAYADYGYAVDYTLAKKWLEDGSKLNQSKAKDVESKWQTYSKVKKLRSLNK